MSISFEGIFPGDRVRIEFAEPLAGWIEGVVHSARRNDVKLATVGAGEMDYLHLVREEVASVAVVQPPIQGGDVVYFQCDVYRVGSGGRGASSLDGFHTRAVNDIPDDAVWLVRGGKLNPKLGGDA